MYPLALEKHLFNIADYVVFCLCLVCSLAIGIYYALTGGKQKTTDEFFMADRKMGFIPVSLSLLVTIMSGITVLGVPAEVYRHGTSYGMFSFSYFLFIPIVAHVFIPVLYDLKITSVYEYLELRFNKTVKLCGTVTYLFMMIVYMGVVLYTPALALNSVTDMNIWLIVVGLCTICAIYTSIGGLKAVIWTDVFQAMVILISQIVILILGMNRAGGLDQVWRHISSSGLLSEIIFDPSPMIAHTFWTLSFGGMFLTLAIYGINQAAVQRFLCCKSKKQAQICIYLNFPLLQLVMLLGISTGLLMYVQYRCNNPLFYGAKPDQLLLYYVMNILGTFQGLPGLFVACIFCASLSTISSCFNSLTAVTMQDIIRPHFRMNETMATKCSKFLVILFAVICVGMSLLTSQMDGILKAALSILGILGGPILGLFIVGILCRDINAIGAVVGFLTSLVVVFWIGFGGIFYRIHHHKLVQYPIYLDRECPVGIDTNDFYNISISLPILTTPISSQVNITSEPLVELYTGINAVYKLSYMWFSGLSVFISILVGYATSFATGWNPNINDKTLHPLMRTGKMFGPRIDKNLKRKEESYKLKNEENTEL